MRRTSRRRVPAVATLLLLILGVSANGAAAAEPLVRTDVFKAGEGGYAHYRIPGIVLTSRGTLLAYCEARATLGGDWGRTDLLIRRSTDGGKTWDAARRLAEPPKDVRKNPIAVEQRLGSADAITMNNPVAIAGDGGVVHFVYCVEYNRCFYMRSDDDGVTFSPPREITPTFDAFRQRYSWRVLATGPGHGIRLTSSGRLIVPVWLSTGAGGHGHRPSCVATIYSDDGGDTWRAGEIVVDHPKLTNPSESALAEVSDGRVMINVRHEGDPRGPAGEGNTTWRAVFVSESGVAGWGEPRLDRTLIDPVCMASLLSTTDRRTLLFANPSNGKTRDRKSLTLRVSRDDGKTWPVSHVIEAGTSGYSDLAATPDGKQVICFYERGVAAKSRPRGVGALTFVRFVTPTEEAR